MATLKNLATGREQTIDARVRVGRARDANLVLEDALVSSEHALIRFTSEGWEVKDLGSRNGTIVDGVRLGAGESANIDLGSHLVFGADAETWELIDADAPGLRATSASGETVLGQGGLLVLPSAEAPECTIYKKGASGFVLERADGGVEEISGEPQITVGKQRFKVFLPAPVEGTPLFDAAPTVEKATFRFRVSLDEETVIIEVLHRGRTIKLEPQWHGYVLLTLARLRREQSELAVEERGWIARDRLLKMLRTDSNNLNVAIHKAREQLIAAGVEDAGAIVEVRRGQRRFGTDRFELATLE